MNGMAITLIAYPAAFIMPSENMLDAFTYLSFTAK